MQIAPCESDKFQENHGLDSAGFYDDFLGNSVRILQIRLDGNSLEQLTRGANIGAYLQRDYPRGNKHGIGMILTLEGGAR